MAEPTRMYPSGPIRMFATEPFLGGRPYKGGRSLVMSACSSALNAGSRCPASFSRWRWVTGSAGTARRHICWRLRHNVCRVARCRVDSVRALPSKCAFALSNKFGSLRAFEGSTAVQIKAGYRCTFLRFTRSLIRVTTTVTVASLICNVLPKSTVFAKYPRVKTAYETGINFIIALALNMRMCMPSLGLHIPFLGFDKPAPDISSGYPAIPRPLPPMPTPPDPNKQ